MLTFTQVSITRLASATQGPFAEELAHPAAIHRERAVALLAPDLDPGGAAKAAELEAQKAIEEANTRALEAQRELEKLKGALADLEKDNDLLRRRLATIPPPLPPRERIIYRPFIIYRDRPRRRPDSERDAQGNGTGGKPAPETKPKTK